MTAKLFANRCKITLPFSSNSRSHYNPQLCIGTAVLNDMSKEIFSTLDGFNYRERNMNVSNHLSTAPEKKLTGYMVTMHSAHI